MALYYYYQGRTKVNTVYVPTAYVDVYRLGSVSCPSKGKVGNINDRKRDYRTSLMTSKLVFSSASRFMLTRKLEYTTPLSTLVVLCIMLIAHANGFGC